MASSCSFLSSRTGAIAFQRVATPHLATDDWPMGNTGLIGLRKAGPRMRRTPQVVAASMDWTSVPAWAVKAVVTKLVPPNPCGGQGYYLDPRTKACVYMCRPGYKYDPETKSCVLVSEVCEPGYVLKDGECEPDTNCGDVYVYDEDLNACAPVQGSIERERSIGDRFLAWAAAQLFESKEESCPVGFYFDPNAVACVPLCAPGYLYDRDLKRCIPIAQVVTEMRRAQEPQE